MASSEYDSQSATILLVDDESRTLRGLKETMPWKQWEIDEVLTASGAEQALELFAAEAPSILLTDIRMPRTDGFSLATQMREIRPSLPVIFMSAYGDVHHLRRAFHLQPIDFLLKPIESSDLQSAIGRALADRKRIMSGSEAVQNSTAGSPQLDAIIIDRICRHIVEGDAAGADELALRWDEVARIDSSHWYLCLATSPEVEFEHLDDRGLIDGSPFVEQLLSDQEGQFRVLGSARGPNLHVSIISVTSESERPDEEIVRRLIGLDRHELYFSTEAYKSLSELAAVASEWLRTRGASSRYVQDAQRFMRSHFADPLTIDDVARAVYLTPSYVCRLFKEKTGETVKEFLLEERIGRACRKIDSGDYYDLSDVARECGFGTYRYFTASFKRIVGVTPSSYAARREHS